MTHEFKQIVEAATTAKYNGITSVLASVVALDGSSYRRPGVRMLVLENGQMIGAVSGGCVEKEILLQSQSVFKTENSKIMTYDGRYRLGCEGVLYILLEIFNPISAFVDAFSGCLKHRKTFEILSYYQKKGGESLGIGTQIKINNELFSVSGHETDEANHTLPVLIKKMKPCFKLLIIGAEHDAVQLCKYAALTGWEITIITSALEQNKSVENFPGANSFNAIAPEQLDVSKLDDQTAIILMTHNFANDLRYLVALQHTSPAYIGLLGPAKRREDLLSQFLEYCPDIENSFLERIHGPAGINIGSETPQEIAVSIISEILAFTRNQIPVPLSQKQGKIHAK